MMTLSQTFTFDAAHTLTRTVPLEEYQASKRMHGHTYSARVWISGQPGPGGMLQIMKKPGELGRKKPQTIDLLVLRTAVQKIRSALDHRLLDEVEGLGAPTLENLCTFIAKNISLPINQVSVWRADGGECTLTLEQP